MISRSLPAALGFLLLCACVSPPKPPPIPLGTQALAGVDFDRLGALSATLRARLGTPEDIRSLLLALTPNGLTTIPSNSDLPARAATLAKSSPLWAVVQGEVTLPLAGNLVNLNRFLHSTEYTTVVVQPGERFSVDITGVCRTADAAQRLEQTLRGFLSIAGAAKGTAETLGTVQVRSEDRMVRVVFTTDRAAVESLLKQGGRSF